jgi:hypothetical protein
LLTPLYVTGGTQRPVGLTAPEEWTLFERAIILRVDPQGGLVDRSLEYVSPPDVCAEDSSITFEGGALTGDTLYTCTRTEALVYRLPQFSLLAHVSLPCFNDIHHVRPTQDGNLLVTSTGLDMVVEVTLDGKTLQEWGVLGESPWIRFSREVDYRKVPSTKPHGAHPNFTFFLNGELWVTRCIKKDAVCLTRPDGRIAVDIALCHDGEVYGGKVYFTTVDGHVVIVDAETLVTETVVDLNKIDNPGNATLGWCRGLGLLDERHVWVGFTRLRETRFKENVRWVKRFIKGEEKPTHIALYDLVGRKRLLEVDLEPYGMHGIFGIFPTAV